jgi:hypothetical protein
MILSSALIVPLAISLTEMAVIFGVVAPILTAIGAWVKLHDDRNSIKLQRDENSFMVRDKFVDGISADNERLRDNLTECEDGWRASRVRERELEQRLHEAEVRADSYKERYERLVARHGLNP